MLDNHTNRDKFEEGVYAFVNNDFDTAVDRFTKVIEEEPEFALAHVSRGAAFARLERGEDSIGDFSKAIELKPDYAKAYHLRGLEYEKSGNHEKALKDFDRAIELDPEYGAAYYSRSAVRAKTGNEELAQEDIETVTMLTERNINAYANENNVWRSRHLKLEAEGVADVMDR